MSNQLTVLTTTSSFNYEGIPGNIRLVRNPHKRRLRENELDELIAEHHPAGIISGVEPMMRKTLESATGLKVISRCGTDLDSIDLKAAKSLGITVYTTRTAPDHPLAELTVTLILSLLKQIRQMDAAVRNGKWSRSMTGLLSEKTVGVIGCGMRGTKVARLLEPFGCQLMGCDAHVRRHEFFDMVEFERIISQADIITLHAPMTSKNYHLIGKEEIARMKDGVLIVNTARGGLIDEAALYEGLKSGKIGGAGLDVFEEEPYLGALNEFPGNVILTPHIGAFAGNYRYDMEKEALENMVKGLQRAITGKS